MYRCSVQKPEPALPARPSRERNGDWKISACRNRPLVEIERTGEMALSVPWLAPQDGEILERAAVNGMRAAPGDCLFRIADHEVVWVIADVAERDLGLISIGQKVIGPAARLSQSRLSAARSR